MSVKVTGSSRAMIKTTENDCAQAVQEICTTTDSNINNPTPGTADTNEIKTRVGTGINRISCNRNIEIMDRIDNGNTPTARAKNSSEIVCSRILRR